MASDSFIGDGLVPSPYELLKQDRDRLAAELAAARKYYEYRIERLAEALDELNAWYIKRRIATPDGSYPVSGSSLCRRSRLRY